MTQCCVRCGERKPLPEFSRRTSAKNGYCSACKICTNKADAEYCAKNKDKILARKKAAYDAAPERFKARVSRWQKANPAICNAKNARYYAQKTSATPYWADEGKIKDFYETATGLGMLTGEWHEVDHIVPINSPLVCGLHCEANLRVITASENASKSNRYWPDMP